MFKYFKLSMVENETSLMLTCPLYIIYQEKLSLTKFSKASLSCSI